MHPLGLEGGGRGAGTRACPHGTSIALPIFHPFDQFPSPLDASVDAPPLDSVPCKAVHPLGSGVFCLAMVVISGFL